MDSVRPDTAETRKLLDLVRNGDVKALNRLLDRYRPVMLEFVRRRLDPRVKGRIDGSDVVQDVQMEVTRRMDDYLRRRPMPFHLWVRKTALERLGHVRRDHRHRAKRSVDREENLPGRSSILLARSIAARGLSPSQQMAAREFSLQVAKAIAELPDTDREVLLMRQVDELAYEEIGQLLDLDPAAARKRYGRALIRLQKRLFELGLWE